MKLKKKTLYSFKKENDADDVFFPPWIYEKTEQDILPFLLSDIKKKKNEITYIWSSVYIIGYSEISWHTVDVDKREEYENLWGEVFDDELERRAREVLIKNITLSKPEPVAEKNKDLIAAVHCWEACLGACEPERNARCEICERLLRS